MIKSCAKYILRGAVLCYFAGVYHSLNRELCVCDNCLEINSNYVACVCCQNLELISRPKLTMSNIK